MLIIWPVLSTKATQSTFSFIIWSCSIYYTVAAKSRQSCPTLCDPIDSSPLSSRPWDSPGKNTGVGCHFLLQCMKVKSESEVAQSCPTLRDPMDCSLPGSSIHGIFQARVLEWGATAFSLGFLEAPSEGSHLPERQSHPWGSDHSSQWARCNLTFSAACRKEYQK